MAISLKYTDPSWSFVAADSPIPVTAETHVAGDRGFIWVAWKDYSVTCTVTGGGSGGWTEITEFADGTTAQGDGTGSMKVACFYRDWVSGDTDPTVDFSASPNIAGGLYQIWQKGGGDTWDTPVFATAASASSAGPVTRSASSTVTVGDGGVVFGLWATPDDQATFTRPTDAIAGTGVTWNGNYVESPATHGSTTTNNDMSADLGHRFVTTGGSGITLDAKITSSTNAKTGAILWVVQSLVTTPTISENTDAVPMFFRHSAIRGAAGGGGGGGDWTPNPASVQFLGDYSTGNLSQWSTVQCVGYNGSPAGYPGGYPVAVQSDATYGYKARFEIRNGDVPPFGGSQRTEVRNLIGTTGSNGQTRWYEWRQQFPSGWSNNGQWGITCQHHADIEGSPPLCFGWTKWDGANNDFMMRVREVMAWNVPIDTAWHHFTLEVKWSTGSDGYIKLWYDQVPQTVFGEYQWFGQTQLSGGSSVYFKEGIYRDVNATATQIAYRTGYRCCTNPDGLTWDITA
jgi:Polysaccharide lyase